MRVRLPMLIPYYGSKARLVRAYPPPRHGTIVEPFAGGAAYALAYADRQVGIVEKYPLLAALWRWLIAVTPAEILRLPLVRSVDELPSSVCQEARWLIGWWLNTCTESPRRSASTRFDMRPNVFWGEVRRELIAEQVLRIKHWQVFECGYADVPVDLPDVTWFVDPPYEGAGKHYVHASDGIDYAHLSTWCRTLEGQVIVCENVGATWLPFEFLTQARSGGSGRMTNAEAVWLNDNEPLAQVA